MKTKLFTLFLFLFIPFSVDAQETIYKKAYHDLTPFTGTWIATKDDMRYEITFKKGILKAEVLETKYEAEVVFATLVRWYKNSILIREVKSDTPESILRGFISEKKPLCLGGVIYYDKEKDCCGEGTFTIDSAENPQTGKWLHFLSRGVKSDFPHHLDFKKSNSAISISAQTNYYTTTKTFNENGYSYQCDVAPSKMVTLYNKNNQWMYTYQVYKSSGESFTMDDDCPNVIEFDTWVDPKCESIVNNAFSTVEKQRVKEHRFTIGMYVNPDTGKVDEIDFKFVNVGPYATIPISVYRKIEMDIKQNIWFVPTDEGRKLNYILYWTAAEPK